MFSSLATYLDGYSIPSAVMTVMMTLYSVLTIVLVQAAAVLNSRRPVGKPDNGMIAVARGGFSLCPPVALSPSPPPVTQLSAVCRV